MMLILIIYILWILYQTHKKTNCCYFINTLYTDTILELIHDAIFQFRHSLGRYSCVTSSSRKMTKLFPIDNEYPMIPSWYKYCQHRVIDKQCMEAALRVDTYLENLKRIVRVAVSAGLH